MLKSSWIKKLKLPHWILIGMGLGIFAGLFLGEKAAIFAPVGEAFIKLLQMTIIPYIMVSLIQGIGSLKVEESKKLVVRAGSMLLLTWLLSYFVLWFFPLAFPHRESGAFFSTSMIEAPKEVNFLDLYIPTNPFHSMANAMVPAVVLFCICIGVALLIHKKKEQFIEQLRIFSDCLSTVTRTISKITPIGVFALVANAAGTLAVDDLLKIQVYIISLIVACFFLSYVALPLLVCALTPFSYRKIIANNNSALITALTTANLFIVLPQLIGNAKALFKEYGQEDPAINNYIDILVPVSFNFPNVGKLVMLLFIPFAAWFNGSTLSVTDYPNLTFSGTMSFFGSVNIAIPFMLDTFHLPADLFQFQLVSGVITSYFVTLLAAMSLFAITVLGTAAMTGNLTWSPKRFINWGLYSGSGLVVVVIALSFTFKLLTETNTSRDEALAKMDSGVYSHLVIQNTTDGELTASNQPLLKRLEEQSVLRFGYLDNSLPLSFRNGKGELVGFDIDLALLFAEQLDCEAQFVTCTPENVREKLLSGAIDLFITSREIAVNADPRFIWSQPVHDTTLCFVTRDYQAKFFTTGKEAIANGFNRFGTISQNSLRSLFERKVPNAQLVQLDSYEKFFAGENDLCDAIIGPAELLSAWTLRHPQYSVVIPTTQYYRYPLGYAGLKANDFLVQKLNNWLSVIKMGPEYKQLYNHWFLGKGAQTPKPRWCIGRDVLELW